MNANDILMYGHRWVHKHLDGLSEDQCLVTGVCGVWSVKDIIAHLASFEWVLVDVLNSCVSAGPTIKLDQYTRVDGDTFNAQEVGKRKDLSFSAVVEDYNTGYAKVMEILPKLSQEDLTNPGSLPWYGMEYSLDDFIVYQYYGHKREHCAQIAVYRDSLGM
ncbi:MAG: DinB family protein [Chloroflexi bacterium]|nr:MAG: DinB family protein [Chloroflexota bacterium]